MTPWERRFLGSNRRRSGVKVLIIPVGGQHPGHHVNVDGPDGGPVGIMWNNVVHRVRMLLGPSGVVTAWRVLRGVRRLEGAGQEQVVGCRQNLCLVVQVVHVCSLTAPRGTINNLDLV